jgi:hypothetical protein
MILSLRFLPRAARLQEAASGAPGRCYRTARVAKHSVRSRREQGKSCHKRGS